MGVIGTIDFLGFLCVLTSIIILVRSWGRTFGQEAKKLLAAILILNLLDVVSNTLEWSGITAGLDPLEDYAELIVPILWIFFFYAYGKTAEISDRKKTEKNLLQANALLTSILESTSDAILAVGQDGRLLGYNQNFVRLWNVPQKLMDNYGDETALNYVLEQLKHPDDFLKKVKSLYADQDKISLDLIPFKDGRIIERYSKPFHIDETNSGRVWSFRDITEQKKTEEALRESEEKFRSIFEEANDGIMIADADAKRQLEANKAICRMLGYRREELIGLRMEDIHPKEALPVIRDLFEKQRRGEISLASDVPMLCKDGSVLYTDVNATSLTLGGRQCLIGIFRDTTEHKQAEDQLNMLGGLVDIAPASIMIHDFEGNIYYANQKALDMHGYSKEEFLSLTLHDLDVPESAALIEARMRQIAANGIAVFEAAHYRKDHTVLPLGVLVKVTEWGGRTVLFSIGTDLTEHKKAAEKLRKSEEFVRNILDTVDEGFIVVDQEYRILKANSAYCRLVGKTEEEIIGGKCHEIRHQRSRPCHDQGLECAIRKVFETGEPHTVLHRHTDDQGKITYIELKGYPIKDQDGSVASVIETLRDTTERHLLEEERLKSQKLESIGTLAGGIAHDFNNLLQGVFGFISLAKMSYDKKDELLSMLAQAEEALHLSVNLTNQLLTFSKGGKPVKKLINVAPVVENAIKFALSGSNTNYELNSMEGLWPVEADDGQLAQVIQNIALNANQAMVNAGTVRVALSNADIARETHASLHGGGYFVRITIQDSGIGISKQHLDRIFDPYFTTKPKGQGLGLATSYSIIKNHGGVIEVNSEENKGSTFTIYIPASREVKTETAPIASDVIGTNKGRILLMDDEEMIRGVAKKMFAALGHDVVFAEDGRAAIALFREAKEAGRPFGLIILDLTVKGGMGGEEAIRKIREIDPDVKAVVSSGYADSPVIANHQAYGFSAVLNKPYRLNALKNCLNTLFQ